MTQAEINILLRARAKEAIATFSQALKSLEALQKAALDAGSAMGAISGSTRVMAVNLGNSSKAAADLAKSLALAGAQSSSTAKNVAANSRAASAAAKSWNAYARAAEYATPKIAAARVGVDKLTVSLHRNSTAADAAAASLNAYTAAAARAGRVPTAPTPRPTPAPGGATTAGSALATVAAAGQMAAYTRATQQATAASQAMARATAATGTGLTTIERGAWRAGDGMGVYERATFRASQRMDQMAPAIGRANQAMALGSANARRFGEQMAIGSSAWQQSGSAGSAALNSVAAASVANAASTGAMTTRWQDFNTTLDRGSTALRRAGSQMQWTGRQLAVMFTAPTLLAGGFGVKWALEQEKAFTQMAKVYDGAIEDIDTNLQEEGLQFSGSKFDKFFTALSEKMGVTKTETAEIGGMWAAVGARGRDLAEAVKLTEEFMVVGNQTAEKSASDLIAIQAQYKISTADLTKTIMDLNAIENQTAVSMRDLTDGFTRTASVAREAGVDTRQLGAFIAALVPAAGTAAVSANGLKSIFTRLMVPTNDAAEVLSQIGINVSDPNWISKNAIDRLKELSDRFEPLSQQQKLDLAKPFAGLYQINKFLTLMDDLASSQGYYAKALAATESPQKSFNLYQRELQRVLESNPQKLKQVGVILQNSLADIVIPLIPHIVYLARAFAGLMKSFAEMDPRMQKFIVLGLLALAAVGPLAMIVGSFVILFGAAGKAIALFSRILAFGAFHLLNFGNLTRQVGDETVRRTPLIARAWQAMMSTVGTRIVAFTRSVPGLLSRMWGLIAQGAARVGPMLLTQLAALTPRLAAWAGVAAGVISGPIGWAILAIVTLFALFPKQMWEATKTLGAVLLTPFTQLLTAVGPILSAVGDLLKRLWARIVSETASAAQQGVPMLAQPFIVGVRTAIAALRALPGAVVQVFKGVVQVIQSAARAVYQAFSYINPFARHSPSLVENVQNGLRIVGDEFRDMADNVSASTADAYEDIRRFGEQTAGLRGWADAIETGKQRDSIGKLDPGALAAYDSLAASLPALEARLDQTTAAIRDQKAAIEGQKAAIEAQEAVIDGYADQIKVADKAIAAMNKTLEIMRNGAEMLSDALDEAKKRLEYYSNAPIKGMGAMADAIFENEMAQKRLRLEIMRMEEAGQSVEDLKDKFADLQGEIENLRGRREELRQAGSGSDILGVYDQMIKDLEAQQGALANETTSPIAAAQKELERLQTEGEKLDLENALKFDPLTRQVEKLTNSTKELSFDEIVRGITANKGAVDGLTLAYDAANSSIKVYEASIEAAEDAKEALNDAMGVEQEKLDGMQENLSSAEKALEELEQQQTDLKTAITDTHSAMDELVQSADAVNAYLEEQARLAEEAKKKLEEMTAEERKAAEAAADWANAGLGDFEVPGGSLEDLMSGDMNFDDLTQSLTDEVSKIFDEIDLTKPIDDFFARVETKIREFPGKVASWIGSIPGKIGEWFLQQGGNVGSWLGGLGASFGAWFGNLWTDHIWPALQNLPGNIGNFLRELPSHLVQAIAYISGYLAGMFAQAFGAAFKIGQKIAEYFTSGAFWEDVKGVYNAVDEWATNIRDHIRDFLTKTLPEAFQAMWDYFVYGGFWEDASGVLSTIGQWLLDVTMKVGDWIGGLPEQFGKMWDYFVSGRFWDDVQGVWDKIYEAGSNLVRGLMDGIVNMMSGIGTWIMDNMVRPFIDGFMNAMGIHSPSTVFAEFGKNMIEGLWEGIKGAGTWFKDKLVSWVEEHVPEPIKKLLDMHSPSRVFMEFGRNIADGLAIGIESGGASATAAAQALANAATDIDLGTGTTGPAPVPVPDEAQVAALGQKLDTVRIVYKDVFTGIGADTTGQTSDLYAALTGATGAYSASTVAQFDALGYGVSASTMTMATQVQNTTATMVSTLTSQMGLAQDSFSTSMFAIQDSGTTAFQNLSANLSSVMSEEIVPMFDSFGPMLETVSGWFGDTVTNVGDIWKGIKEPVAVPSRFIVNDVYNSGIRVAWNNVSGWLGLAELPEAVAAFRSGGALVDRAGLANPNSPRDITRGGRLNGSISGDRTLFAGQGGEFVWSRQAVDNAGGLGVMSAMHAAARAGRSLEGAGAITGLLPGFAAGGGIPGKVLEGQDWARKTFTGQKYVYGGVGPDGFDCSGAAGAMWAYLTDKPNPFQRWFTTEANFASFGFDRGLNGAFTMGVHNGGGGVLSHVASTLGGINLEAGGSHNSSIFGGPAAGSDHPQFENQYTLREIGGVFSSGGMGGGSAPSMLERVTAEFKRIMDPIRDTWPQANGLIKGLDPTGYQKNYDEVSRFLYGKAGEYDAAHPPMGNMAYNGAGVEQWRPLVQKVLAAKGYPLSLDEVVLRRMNQESGGNPNAINLWDSNAAAGRPSKGLMQTIDSTFQAYKDAGYDNIWDPESNLRASMNYARARYGSLEAAYNRPGGYDSGGLLPPTPDGYGTFYNHTGGVEPVLTDWQWTGMMKIADSASAFSAETIEEGVTAALTTVYGYEPVADQAMATAAAVEQASDGWTPTIVEAADAQVAASQATAAAAEKTKTGVDKFVEVGGQIQTTVSNLSEFMVALSGAMQNPNSFGAWAPVINAAAKFIEELPDQVAEYVPWAGTNQPVTEEMKRQKAANDAVNIAKGIFQLGKEVLPPIMKHTALIGSAIEQLMVTMGPVVTAAIAMFPVNPVGAAIMLIPVILQGIFTILPLIINAIMEIVPALIKAIIKFITQFMPDSVYAYEDLAAAEQAVRDNESAIKAGASAPHFVVPVAQQNPNENSPVVINVYGVTVENSGSGSAEQFVHDLENLAR